MKIPIRIVTPVMDIEGLGLAPRVGDPGFPRPTLTGATVVGASGATATISTGITPGAACLSW
jgi:hypothetical protein